jgi:hypothetical protein
MAMWCGVVWCGWDEVQDGNECLAMVGGALKGVAVTATLEKAGKCVSTTSRSYRHYKQQDCTDS